LTYTGHRAIIRTKVLKKPKSPGTTAREIKLST
jgi:hypothetical protein